MIGERDPLIGTLPQQNNSGSPALAGQPPAIAGAGSTPQVPTPQMQGGPALAPAPPQSGSAEIGAPLSNEAPEQSAGAGANLDLVQDRGTPRDYWSGNMSKLGSKQTIQLMAQASEGSSGRTGQMAQQDPEEVRRQGTQINAQMGLETREQQDEFIQDGIYDPVDTQIDKEIADGVITPEEGAFRSASTRAMVQGVENEEELQELVVTAAKRGAGNTEELEGEEPTPEEKKNIWQRFKAWWKKGADDPNTPEDESQETYYVDGSGNEVEEGTPGAIKKTRDVEVTRFMGGMTRQELGMFVFQWGALMMSNAEEGFGGAMGAAGQGAMAGHLGRQAAGQAGALDQQKADASTAQAAAAQQRADAATHTAMQPEIHWSLEGAFTIEVDEKGNTIHVPVLDDDGNQVQESPSSANRPYATQELQKQLEATGFFTPQEVAILISKQPGTGDVRSDALKSWERRMAQDIFPNGMRASDWRALPDNERTKLRTEFVDSYVDEYMRAYDSTPDSEGALPGSGDAGKDAVDQYSE